MKKNIKFLFPLLLLLSVIILSRDQTHAKVSIGDEAKFYWHAKNITKGFYTDANNPLLVEGPGYPLYLSLWAAFDIPYVWIRSSHIFLLFFTAWYLFIILHRYLKRTPALWLTYFFGLYPPMMRWANLMYAESLTLLLIVGFSYHFIKWYNKEGKFKSHFIFAAFFLGYLALTKIIFAYVIVTTLIALLIFRLSPKITKAYQLKRMVILFSIALLVVCPYVLHTYQLTNKYFYLGTHGGSVLYFRSTPFDNEYGNWFSEWHVLKDIGPEMRKGVMANTDKLRKNHESFLSSIDSLPWIEKDSAFKAKAIMNIREHPEKYFFENTAATISRMFFHFPFSYRMQNMATLGYLIPNMFIVVLATFGIYPAVIRRKIIPKELIILLLLSFIYFGGHTLLDGRGRFFIPIVPIWIMFFSFVYFRILKINIRDKLTSATN